MPGAAEDRDRGSAIPLTLVEEANGAVNTDIATTTTASATSSSASESGTTARPSAGTTRPTDNVSTTLGSTAAYRAENSGRQTPEEQLLGATRLHPSRVAVVAIQVAAAAVVVPVAVEAPVDVHLAEAVETGVGEDGRATGLGGGGRLTMVTTLIKTSLARRTPAQASRKNVLPRSCTTSTSAFTTTPTTSSISTSTAAQAGPGVMQAQGPTLATQPW